MFVDVQGRKLSDASFSVIKGHIIITFFLGWSMSEECLLALYGVDVLRELRGF